MTFTKTQISGVILLAWVVVIIIALELFFVWEEDFGDARGSNPPPATTSIAGSMFEVFADLTESSTSSLSMVSKLDVTTEEKPAGIYRVSFRADLTNNSGGFTSDIEFMVDGTTITSHDNGSDFYSVETKNSNDWQSVHSIKYVTLASPGTIDLDINYSNGTGMRIARISNAIIEIWRVN